MSSALPAPLHHGTLSWLAISLSKAINLYSQLIRFLFLLDFSFEVLFQEVLQRYIDIA